MKSIFTLAWSKHHRARKGLNFTKATFLLRQRFILRIFYISLDLFWFFHFWAGSVRRGNIEWKEHKLLFRRPFSLMPAGPIGAAASSSIK